MSAYDIMLLEEAKAFIKVMPKSAQDYFKKLTGTDDIWEFRVADSDKWYRILAFFTRSKDGKITVVIATHGFEKEGAKKPQQQLTGLNGLKRIFRQQVVDGD